MFLYFKRREKRGKREAPRPRFLVLRRKTLTVGAALLAAAAIFGAVNAPAAVRASVATRQLPIYCVERDQKVCSISFDAAWGADNTQKILDVLADYGVKATFFVVGNWADQYPEQAKAIVDSGCELMNHSILEMSRNVQSGNTQNLKNCGGIESGCLLRLHPLPVPRRRQPKRVACIDPDAVVVDKNIAKNDRFDLFSR